MKLAREVPDGPRGFALCRSAGITLQDRPVAKTDLGLFDARAFIRGDLSR
jgi:hypothetical protein